METLYLSTKKVQLYKIKTKWKRFRYQSAKLIILLLCLYSVSIVTSFPAIKYQPYQPLDIISAQTPPGNLSLSLLSLSLKSRPHSCIDIYFTFALYVLIKIVSIDSKEKVCKKTPLIVFTRSDFMNFSQKLTETWPIILENSV